MFFILFHGTVIMYFFTPIPNFMCGMCNRPDRIFYYLSKTIHHFHHLLSHSAFGDGNRGWKNSGFFLTAILIVSGIGILSFH